MHLAGNSNYDGSFAVTVCSREQAMDEYDNLSPYIRDLLKYFPIDIELAIPLTDYQAKAIFKDGLEHFYSVSTLATYGPDHPEVMKV